MSGTLVVCGAPIGDVRDASPRLAEILATADLIAAEDTRRVVRLAQALGVTIPGRVVSCYDAVEGARAAMIADRLREGATVALVTDAGMPAVSDPGFRVVAAAAAAGMTVTVVPGPSAVTAALAVSGLPSDRWTFEGFLPRRGAERRGRLRELSGEPRTMVFLESPHRVTASLADLATVFGGPRPAVLCRELTKTFEEIVRGGLADLHAWATDGRVIRGEFTLVVTGAPRRPPATIIDDAAEAASGAIAATGTSGSASEAVVRAGVGAGADADADADVHGATAADAGGRVSADAVAEADSVAEDHPDAAVGAVTVSAQALAGQVAQRAAAGMSRKDARRAVAQEYGLSRNDVYAAELTARGRPTPTPAERPSP